MSLHQVHERLYFGMQEDCPHDGKAREGRAVVHACKIPCHCRAVNYKGSLESDHPHYLFYEDGFDLYLNLIDPPVPLFKKESFDVFFDFVDRQIKERPVMIHCNQGCSRAPSLALLYMAKRLGTLPNESYEVARTAFEKCHPYQPGAGIVKYLQENWGQLGQ